MGVVDVVVVKYRYNISLLVSKAYSTAAGWLVGAVRDENNKGGGSQSQLVNYVMIHHY